MVRTTADEHRYSIDRRRCRRHFQRDRATLGEDDYPRSSVRAWDGEGFCTHEILKRLSIPATLEGGAVGCFWYRRASFWACGDHAGSPTTAAGSIDSSLSLPPRTAKGISGMSALCTVQSKSGLSTNGPHLAIHIEPVRATLDLRYDINMVVPTSSSIVLTACAP